MKASKILLLFFLIGFLTNCKQKRFNVENIESKSNNQYIIGKWTRIGHNGPLSITFKENETVDIDLGNDKSIDVTSKYLIENDTVKFFDEAGKSCPESGEYKIYNRNYTISFDVINDNCNGRIKSTMGFWIRPNFKNLISELDNKINNSNSIHNRLHRARIYMAIGKPQLAKKDFDAFILIDSTNAKVYINRAGTRFPNDLSGVVSDCNKAVILDSTDKNAYFLRGLALYEIGEKQKACDDFHKAIGLGFSILAEAEKEKCEAFWKKYQD